MEYVGVCLLPVVLRHMLSGGAGVAVQVENRLRALIQLALWFVPNFHDLFISSIDLSFLCLAYSE